MPINGTGRNANRRLPSWLTSSPLPPSDAQKEHRRPNDEIISDPASDILIDFNSSQGFHEAAKKSKKAKTPSAPPPPPPPPAAPPANNGQKDDMNAGGGGTSEGSAAGGAGDGNGSGGGGAPPLRPPTTFDNISLGASKLDLGLSPPENKSISSWGAKLGFGGGGWGWGGGAKNEPQPAPAPPPPPESKDEDNPWDKPKGSTGDLGMKDDDDAWGFGTKKDKKASALWGAEPEEEPKDAGDPWGWGNQKKKGKPGGILEELALDTEPEGPPGGKKDIWDTWGISKKDRAKKKGIMEEVALAAAPDPPSMDDQWGGGWSGKKDKSPPSSLWGAQDPIPAVPDPPSFEDKDSDDFWSTFGSGKAKPVEDNSGGWGGSWGIGKTGEDDTCESNFYNAHRVPEPPKIEDDGRDLWGTGKRKKKAGDLIQLEDEIPPPAPDPVEAVGSGDFLDSWGFGKKPKKPAVDPFDFKTSGADDPNDAFWGSIDTKHGAHDFLIDTTGKITQGDVEADEKSWFNDREQLGISKSPISTLTDLLLSTSTPPLCWASLNESADNQTRSKPLEKLKSELPVKPKTPKPHAKTRRLRVS